MQINSGADYKIIKGIADDEELENYRQCFKNNGTERDIKNLKWLHQQNLTNNHTIYYAIHNSTVAAIYTAMPVIFNINRHKAIALQSIDTITDANHRGKGLFPKLATKLVWNWCMDFLMKIPLQAFLKSCSGCHLVKLHLC